MRELVELVLLWVCSLAVVPVVAAAPITYALTGRPLSGVTADCPPSCTVGGWFQVPDPLAPNLAVQTITPAAFAFGTPSGWRTDDPGLQPLLSVGFSAGTDGAGQIDQWAVHLDLQDASHHWTSESTGAGSRWASETRGDTAAWAEVVGHARLTPARVEGSGAWAEMPEPGTGVLVGLGALLLAWRRARRGART